MTCIHSNYAVILGTVSGAEGTMTNSGDNTPVFKAFKFDRRVCIKEWEGESRERCK
jgi:hypothetical protein